MSAFKLNGVAVRQLTEIAISNRFGRNIKLNPDQLLNDERPNEFAVALALAIETICEQVEKSFEAYVVDAVANARTEILEWASIHLMEEWQRRITAASENASTT